MRDGRRKKSVCARVRKTRVSERTAYSPCAPLAVRNSISGFETRLSAKLVSRPRQQCRKRSGPQYVPQQPRSADIVANVQHRTPEGSLFGWLTKENKKLEFHRTIKITRKACKEKVYQGCWLSAYCNDAKIDFDRNRERGSRLKNMR